MGRTLRPTTGSRKESGYIVDSPDDEGVNAEPLLLLSQIVFRAQIQHQNPSIKKPGLTICINQASFVATDDDHVSDMEFGELAKSPTLHISGVSISRSPGASPNNLLSAKTTEASAFFGSETLGRGSNRNRSSSLNVPHNTVSLSSVVSPRSPGSKSLHACAISPPALSATVSGSISSYALNQAKRSSLTCSPRTVSQFMFPPPPPLADDLEAGAGGKEAEKPSTPATATLSSVLHIHDANLSSDDFHEALFLGKSPKSVKRRSGR